MNNHNDNHKGSASLARKRNHFTVAASPLNHVKLDLAIIMVMAVIVLLLVNFLVTDHLQQFMWLGTYGLLALAWLVFRIRRVLQQWPAEEQDRHET